MKESSPPRIKKFSAAKQRRLDELLEKNREGTIAPSEKKRLERLVQEAEELMIENAQRLVAFSASEPKAPTGAVPVTVWVNPEPVERS
jgi:hypothetical protein